MCVRHVNVLVQPVTPMAYRLLGIAPGTRSFLGALDGCITLFVVGNMRDHGCQQDESSGAFGKLERLDAERLVVSCCGSPPPAGSTHTCIRFSVSSSGLRSLGWRFDKKPKAPSWWKQGVVSCVSLCVSCVGGAPSVGTFQRSLTYLVPSQSSRCTTDRQNKRHVRVPTPAAPSIPHRRPRLALGSCGAPSALRQPRRGPQHGVARS